MLFYKKQKFDIFIYKRKKAPNSSLRVHGAKIIIVWYI